MTNHPTRLPWKYQSNDRLKFELRLVEPILHGL